MLTVTERLPGGDPRTYGRDPRTQVMERALGLGRAQAVLVMFLLVGAWEVVRPSLLVSMRVGSLLLLGTVRPCSELLRGLRNRGGGMLRRLIGLLHWLVGMMW